MVAELVGYALGALSTWCIVKKDRRRMQGRLDRAGERAIKARLAKEKAENKHRALKSQCTDLYKRNAELNTHLQALEKDLDKAEAYLYRASEKPLENVYGVGKTLKESL